MPFAQVNGISVSYSLSPAADADATPAVLICGLGQPALSWNLAIAPGLEEAGLQVLIYDLRGMPPSECPPAPYTVSQMAADCIGLLDHLDLAPAHLIGYSLGGWIAEEVALQRPDLVRSVAFLGSANPPTEWERIRYPLGAELARELDPYPPGLDVVDTLSYMTPQQLQDDETVALWRGLIEAGERWQNPGRVGQWDATVDWIARGDPEARWRALEMPALVLAFEADVDSPPDGGRVAAAALPAATYVEIPSVGHMGVIERPVEVIAALVNFLTSS